MNAARELTPAKQVAPPRQLRLGMDAAPPIQLAPREPSEGEVLVDPELRRTHPARRAALSPDISILRRTARGNAKKTAAKKKHKPSRRMSSQVSGGAVLFQRVFTRLGCDGRPPRL